MGIGAATKDYVVSRLWRHIEQHGLLDFRSPSCDLIRCDEALKALFGAAEVRLGDMGKLLEPKLSTYEGVALEHTIGAEGRSIGETGPFPARSPLPPCFYFLLGDT